MPDNSHMPTSRMSRQPLLWPFFVLGLLLLLLFWGVNMWLTRGLEGNVEPEEAQRAEVRAKNLAELRADDAKKLESYAWVDRAKGSVQIPIAEAMKLVAAELASSPPRPAYPVATPAPAAAPAISTPAASPAAPTPPATP